MRLIVITRPDFFEDEAVWIEALLDAGIDIMHLRKPAASEQEMNHLINAIKPQYHSRIVLHDCFSLTKRYNLLGLHINTRNSTIPPYYNGFITRSCHTLEEVELYKGSFSYLFLSPIFNSISKQGYTSAFNFTELKIAQQNKTIDEKVIALGGVNEKNILDIQALGFGGAAMLGEIWNSPNIELAIEKIKRIRNMITSKGITPPKVLSIAGSDPSGGAGIQADIKAITALNGYAATAITALTIQNTQGVESIFAVPAQTVTDQIRIVMEDIEPQAVKIGMVNDKKIVSIIARSLLHYAPQHVVYDPVMVSTSGHKLIEEDTIDFIESELIPHVKLLTPNLHEAEVLWRKKILSIEDMKQTAKELHDKYNTAILIKGGHLDGNTMCDILCDAEGRPHCFESKRVLTQNLHGTGCTLSSAIATLLAHGHPMHTAIALAKEYVLKAIEQGSTMNIGHGNGPLWHNIKKE